MKFTKSVSKTNYKLLVRLNLWFLLYPRLLYFIFLLCSILFYFILFLSSITLFHNLVLCFWNYLFTLIYLGLTSCQRSWTKYLRQTLVFMWNSALWEKLNFHFQGVLWWYWQNIHFGRKTGHWAIILWNLEIFLIFPNVLRS